MPLHLKVDMDVSCPLRLRRSLTIKLYYSFASSNCLINHIACFKLSSFPEFFPIISSFYLCVLFFLSV